jgi:hypothetical protein
MASQTQSATVAADSGSGGTNAWSISGVGGIITLTGGQTSNHLRYTSFGFTIPAGATILGVMVNLVGTTGIPTINSGNFQLLKASSEVGTTGVLSLALSSSAFFIRGAGGPGNMWGTTLTPSDVNATGFGLSIQALVASGTLTAGTPSLTVYYQPSGGPTGGGPATQYPTFSDFVYPDIGFLRFNK